MRRKIHLNGLYRDKVTTLMRTLALPLVLLSLVFASASSHAVIGGSELNINSAPATVALLNRNFIGSQGNGNFDAQFCAGTVIARRWVLTAAHCMFDNFLSTGNRLSANDVLVLMGSTELENPVTNPRPVNVSEIIIHEQFVNVQGGYDIALLRLESNATVEPIAVDTHPVGTISDSFVAGWGSTVAAVSNPVRSNTLRYVRQFMTPGEKCNTYSFTNASMLCVGTYSGGKGACAGDSGGPLYRTVPNRVKATTLMGINSFGDSRTCHRERAGSGYTRVASHLDWLRTKTSLSFPPTPTQNPQAAPKVLRVDNIALQSGAGPNDWWQVQTSGTHREVYQGLAKPVQISSGEYNVINLITRYRKKVIISGSPSGVLLHGEGWWQIQESDTQNILYQGPAQFVRLRSRRDYDIVHLNTGFWFVGFYVF